MYLASRPAVSVNSSVTLPAEPTNGTLVFTPLGGDGFASPRAMYQLSNFAITGDVSGGSISLDVVMDSRYCTMIAYATMLYSGTGTDPLPILWRLQEAGVGGRSPLRLRQVSADVITADTGGARVNDMWVPPAFVDGASSGLTLTISTDNQDAGILQMFASIFIFDINARQRVPFELLVRARGGGIL